MKSSFRLFGLLLSLLTLNLAPLWADASEETTLIDTLVLYSPTLQNDYHDEVETRIEHLMEVTNTIFTESQLPIKINPIQLLPYAMDDAAKSSTVITTLQADHNISDLRDRYGADLVIIYRRKVANDNCGIAYINDGRSDYSFAHISIDCSDYYTAHEVGHTLGLYHSIKESPDVGYARGHGVEYAFSTVMTYQSHYHSQISQKFSNPKLECYGYPCGVEEGEFHEADAAKALLDTAPIVANFKPTQRIVFEETLAQAKAQYLYYQAAFETAQTKLEELYNAYQEINATYNASLQHAKQTMQSYQTAKIYYNKLKRNYQNTQDKSVKEMAHKEYENLNKLSNSKNFSDTYALLVKKNKLERVYKTYKSSIYDALQIEYTKAKSYYEQLQAHHG